MRQIWFPRAGGPEVMEVREAPDPTPGPGEVRVAVEAVGVNFADLVARMGQYPDAPPFPFVVGYELAGTIDAVGAGVSAARVGEPILAMTKFGAYTTSACLPAGYAIPRPKGMPAEIGAAIPVAYLTSWMMLRVMGRVEAGDRVLIHSAAGGVGLACIDLCRQAGAEMWGSAGRSKHTFLQERGCQHVLDSHVDEWPAEKMDLVLDARGGASWGRSLEQLRAGGRLVAFGMSSGSQGENPSWIGWLRAAMSIPWLKTNPVALINANKGVLGVNMGHLWDEAERAVEWTHRVVGLWDEGVLRPHIHAKVPFAEVARAHRMLHQRENVGKVLLVP